jgi:hypothetical protein
MMREAGRLVREAGRTPRQRWPCVRRATSGIFVAPFYRHRERHSTGNKPAILFSLRDFPLRKNLGICRKEAHPAVKPDNHNRHTE